uniref:Uncharacterized protein n=1 Tax=Chenopodium quinoa TaxID=63459 RepID=A0A803M622_CHEQI
MTTYKLDETPDTYISALVDQGSCVYRMLSIKGESSYTYIRDIDLKKDKLIVYGTEIKESMWEKLHNSLLLRAKSGKVYVDCNGACYIVVYQTIQSNIVTNNLYRPIDNVIFDWSQFGVIVPNSVNDSLRKQLQPKDQELMTMSSLLSSAKGEASACRKQQQDTEMELQKVSNQLGVKEFELNATKTKLELSKEEVKELQDQVSNSNKKDYRNLEMELQKVQHQLSSTMSELETTKIVWEFSKEQLISSKKENEEIKVKIQSMQDQVYKAVADLQSERLKFESQILSCQKENEDVITELQKVQNELSFGNLELQLTKNRLETSDKKILELEEQLSSGGKVQEQLCLIMNELQSIKILVDFTADKEVDLKDQCSYKRCVTKAVDIVDDQ